MNSIKIIIAEDHRILRDAIKFGLNEFGIETIGDANNGHSLLELLKTQTADLIVLDIEMPELDGSEALREIKRLYPEIKVIMFSQYDNPLIMADFIEKGANVYLCKNSTMVELAFVIKIVVEKGYYYDNIVLLNKKFTKREKEIIPLLSNGKTNAELANQLNVCVKTIEAHRNRIYQKTNCNSLKEFLFYAIKNGLNYIKEYRTKN